MMLCPNHHQVRQNKRRVTPQVSVFVAQVRLKLVSSLQTPPVLQYATVPTLCERQIKGGISVGNRDYHYLSHPEIASDKRISQHLSAPLCLGHRFAGDSWCEVIYQRRLGFRNLAAPHLRTSASAGE
jgi:hypothetical protein